MANIFKFATILGAGLLLAAGSANAIPVPAGTVTLSQKGYSPTVDTTNGTVMLGTTTTARKGVSYSSGTGQFANAEDPPLGQFSFSTISFNTTAGGVVDYSGANAINNFFTFYDADDNGNILETYVFDLDQSLTTASNTITGQGTTIGLYFLGDMTATGSEGNFTDLTPTALTLTLNSTGVSNWAFSGTLSNPPPGVNPVPEPASMTLLGGGLAALGFLRRRRARK
jgi:hypothetical protein